MISRLPFYLWDTGLASFISEFQNRRVVTRKLLLETSYPTASSRERLLASPLYGNLLLHREALSSTP